MTTTEDATSTAPFHPEGGGDEAEDVMCTACGWTFGMICPECPGCGCYNSQCSGWRHAGYAQDADDDSEPGDCGDPECEGCDTCSPYGMAYGQVGW